MSFPSRLNRSSRTTVWPSIVMLEPPESPVGVSPRASRWRRRIRCSNRCWGRPRLERVAAGEHECVLVLAAAGLPVGLGLGAGAGASTRARLGSATGSPWPPRVNIMYRPPTRSTTQDPDDQQIACSRKLIAIGLASSRGRRRGRRRHGRGGRRPVVVSYRPGDRSRAGRTRRSCRTRSSPAPAGSAAVALRAAGAPRTSSWASGHARHLGGPVEVSMRYRYSSTAKNPPDRSRPGGARPRSRRWSPSTADPARSW